MSHSVSPPPRSSPEPPQLEPLAEVITQQLNALKEQTAKPADAEKPANAERPEQASTPAQAENTRRQKAVSDTPHAQGCDAPLDPVIASCMRQLFALTDADNDSLIQPGELVNLLTSLTCFNLTCTEVEKIIEMASPHTEGARAMQYEAFAHIVLKALNPVVSSVHESSREEMLHFLIDMCIDLRFSSGEFKSWADLPKEELQDYLRVLFAINDGNRDGALELGEFVKLVNKSVLPIPEKLVQEVSTRSGGLLAC